MITRSPTRWTTSSRRSGCIEAVVIRRIHVPLLAPEDVIRHLGAPHHWKEGRSAKSLTDQWWSANDLPATIRRILDQADEWRNAELIDAFVERCTNLADGRASHSQSDLMAILGLTDGIGLLAIEAKVDEGFDKTVAEWLRSDSVGKRARLAKLCGILGLTADGVGHLRYQLFHRTIAAVLEAKRYRSGKAAMIVQSWSADHDGFADYATFFTAVGLRIDEPGRFSEPATLDGVSFRTAWSAEG